MTQGPSEDPFRKFFGRRKGPQLSARKQDLLATVLPAIRLDVPEDGALDPATIFDRPTRALWLEIGFGKGEHLVGQAQAHPDIGLIGCEPYLNGTVGLLAAVQDEQIHNIRVYPDDARDVMEALPAASIDRVFLLHPDPWPKRRHRYRRFVNHNNLDLVARVLKPGGLLRITTDDPTYREWSVLKMLQRGDFAWTAQGRSDWLDCPDLLLRTRYASKAEREGRYDVYLDYRRVG